MTGTVFNIQKFSIHDGPGIRTTVFLKGCPLHCLWCHNPESLHRKPELLLDAKKCTKCGKCATVCPQNCHQVSEMQHALSRAQCLRCGACASHCPSGALELCGREMSVEEVMEQVEQDSAFYQTSGGGLTLSGGEPMLQFSFSLALLRAAKARGLHTCMETCGVAEAEQFREIAPLVDLFLFDCKETDAARHRAYTGADNQAILQNLRLLDALGRPTVLRCPIIPGYNDTEAHFAGIAALAGSLSHILRIDVEPYHPMGASKSAMLGKDYPLADVGFPTLAQVANWVQCIRENTAVPVETA